MFPNASDLERTSAGAWIISWSLFLLVLSVLTVNGSTVSQCLQSYLHLHNHTYQRRRAVLHDIFRTVCKKITTAV